MISKKTLLWLLSPAMLVFSCAKDKAPPPTAGFDFVVLGNINGAEGQQLALTIPGTNLDDRMISTVREGKIQFSGSLQHPQRAAIVVEKEISEPDGNQANFHIFLTRDTLEFQAEFVDDHYYPGLRNAVIIKGDLNAHYRSNIDRFYEPSSGIRITSDKKYMDSLRKNVFPQIRSAQFALYERYFADPGRSLAGVYVLRSLLDKNALYPFESLSAAEKEKLTSYFQQIDTSLAETHDYQVTSLYIEKMNSGSRPVFHDFELRNQDGGTTRLSDVARKNKITVLDFWWYGCVPCRKFNRDMRQHYSRMRAHGIAIVGINTDGSIDRWQKASAADSIAWVNLYAGERSPIEIAYDVTYAPFKVVVDSQLNILDVSSKTVDDLIKAAALQH